MSQLDQELNYNLERYAEYTHFVASEEEIHRRGQAILALLNSEDLV